MTIGYLSNSNVKKWILIVKNIGRLFSTNKFATIIGVNWNSEWISLDIDSNSFYGNRRDVLMEIQ